MGTEGAMQVPSCCGRGPPNPTVLSVRLPMVADESVKQRGKLLPRVATLAVHCMCSRTGLWASEVTKKM